MSTRSVLRQVVPTPALLRVLPWAAAMAIYSGLAVWKERTQFEGLGDFPPGLEAALSLLMGLLLAFRVNRAFDRWWEGRILWGTLVNACRNFAAKAHNAVDSSDPDVDRLRRLIVAFPAALRDHLRDGARIDQLPSLAGEDFSGKHLPSWISNQIYGILAKWRREGKIDVDGYLALDGEAKVLLEICGGCERIRSTPIAVSFRILLNQAIAVLLLTLPWGFAEGLGVWLIPVTFLTSYFVIAAEAIADHIEQPFGAEGDGLDLDRISGVIGATVNEIFETEVVA